MSQRAPTLMAARRIASDPYATFRAISSVVVAAFVTTMFAGSATGIQANLDHCAPAALRPAAVEIFTNALPGTLVDPLAAHLASTAGVRQVVTARHRPDAPNTLSVSCADLAAAINITCTAAPTLAGRTPRSLAGVSTLREPDPSRGSSRA
jgi:hypothetical protein